MVNEYVSKVTGARELDSYTVSQQKLSTSLSGQQKLMMVQTQRIKELNGIRSKGIPLTARQRKELDHLSRSYKMLGGDMRKLGGRQQDLLARFTKFRWLLVNIAMATMVAIGAFKLFIKPSVDLETEMANVRKTTGFTRDEIQGLSEDMIYLSTILPISAIDLAKIAVVAGQLGLGEKGAEAIKQFTTVVGLMSTATEMTAEEAATNLAKLSQAFNIPISQVNNLGSVINELSNTTAATSTEITKSLTRIGSAAANLGLSVEFVAAFSSTLIAAGMRAERSGTRIRTALTRITANIAEFSELANMSIPEFTRLLEIDAEQALLKVLEALRGLESGTERAMITTRLFGRVGGFAIQTLVNNYDELMVNLETANNEMETGLSLIIETGVQAATTASQWQLLVNQIKAATFHENTYVKALIEDVRMRMESQKITDLLFGTMLGATKVKKRFIEESRAEGKAMIELAKQAGYSDEEINNMIQDINELAQISYPSARDQIRRYTEMLRASIGVQKEEEDQTGTIIALYESFEEALKDYTMAREELSEAEEGSIVNYVNMALNLKDVKDKINDSFGPGSVAIIESFYNSLDKTEQITDKLSDALRRATGLISIQTREFREQTSVISDSLTSIREQMSETQSVMSVIAGGRFAGQTQLERIIRQQEIAIRRAKFEALGLGTAEEFLAKASSLTGNALTRQVETLDDLADSAERAQREFDAWETTLQETIKELVISSTDLSRDVTDVIKEQQEKLLGTEFFQTRGTARKTIAEQNLERLQEAMGIVSSDFSGKIQEHIQMRKDEQNVLYATADAAIAAWESERSSLENLIAKEGDLIAQREELNEKIDANTMRVNRLRDAMNNFGEATERNINSAISNFDSLLSKLREVERIGGGGGGGGGGFMPGSPFAPGGFAPASQGFQDLAKSLGVQLQRGGIVQKPTFALLGESGPEAVIPLNKTKEIGAKSYTLNFSIANPNISERGIALEVKRELKALA